MDEKGAALAAVGASVLAVLAVLTIPHWFSAQGRPGPTVPSAPSSPRSSEPPGIRTWQPVTCSSRPDDGCAVPAAIDHGGLLIRSNGGRRLTWYDEPGAPSATVRMTVPASRSDRWVLVGGRYTGGDSRVAVEIGPEAPVLLPADRLSLFALQGHAAMVVRVADFGNARDGEVLRIEEYTDR